MSDTGTMIRDLLAVRLKASATIDMQMATALTRKGQDELRKHFIDSASLMVEAAKALSSPSTIGRRLSGGEG